MTTLKKLLTTTCVAAAALASAFTIGMGSASADEPKKFKIFLSLSYSGNAWQSEAANIVKALAQTPPYDKMVEQQETAKALAAHPDVDGIWAQAGEFGAIQALRDKGTRLVPMTGENSNGFRLALADPEAQKNGLKGVSAGSPPATAGYAFKLMMEILTKKRDLKAMNIQYPLPWVPAEKVTLCKGDTFEDGCNTFPDGKVPSSFVTEVFSPEFLPELSLKSALDGAPTPGKTIQPLPAEVVKAPNEPGINCQKCEPPTDLYKLTKVEPTVKP